MNKTIPHPSPGCLSPEIDETIEFYLETHTMEERYIGKIQHISRKYLTIYRIIPSPGLENFFPERDKKIVILTGTFIVKILTETEREEKHASRYN